MKNRLAPVLMGCAGLFVILLAPSAIGSSSAVPEGSLTSASFRSATLNEDIHYNVYLPAGYADSAERYPVLYLLHGRGDSMSAWTQMKSTLDELIAAGEIQPTIAIMPDAPWSSRASYYVDSALHRSRPWPAGRDRVHQGSDPARRRRVSDGGRPDGPRRRGLLDGRLRRVALLARASRSLRRGDRAQPGRVRPDPTERLQHARVRRLRPGQEPVRRLDLQEAELSGPASARSRRQGLSLPMFIAVGDDEFKNPLPKDYVHDLDFEAHVLFNQAARVENLTAELRVVDGGHDWDVWGPQFVEGAKYIFQFLNQAPATVMKATLTGTAQEERAGGVATDAAGNVYQALAAGGSVNGQPLRGRQGSRARQGRADRHDGSGRASSAPPGSSGRTASRSTRRATSS